MTTVKVHKANMMFVLVVVVLSFKTVYSLQCYNCANIRNISDCQSLTTCSSGYDCFTDTSGLRNETRFTLGCRYHQTCLTNAASSSASIVGRSLQNNLECSQCCAVDSCNKHICSAGTHVVDTSVCEDDPSYNCSQISSVFSICSDTHHAKLVCRKFCGLCGMVPGNWSTWSGWSSCDTSCGLSTKSRYRYCNNPAPQNGGLPCVGPSTDSKLCNLTACPDGVWSSWSFWSLCSASCLSGISKRIRTCKMPGCSTVIPDCIGSSQQTKQCNSFPCPAVIRLVDGSNAYEGRLEVYHNGGWGTVCDDSFNDKAAILVCKMLNVSGAIPKVYSGGHFGVGSLPILLDDVTCDGTENILFDCRHNTWGTNNCGHGEDVGVSCLASIEVRLGGGNSSHTGLVEVSVDGSTWGTICDDSFTSNGAKVVCRMLGYPSSNASAYTSPRHGSGQIFLDDVNCVGTESSLDHCKHSTWGVNDCTHSEDVGVICA